jgi:hypothetical protein
MTTIRPWHSQRHNARQKPADEPKFNDPWLGIDAASVRRRPPERTKPHRARQIDLVSVALKLAAIMLAASIILLTAWFVYRVHHL